MSGCKSCENLKKFRLARAQAKAEARKVAIGQLNSARPVMREEMLNLFSIDHKDQIDKKAREDAANQDNQNQ